VVAQVRQLVLVPVALVQQRELHALELHHVQEAVLVVLALAVQVAQEQLAQELAVRVQVDQVAARHNVVVPVVVLADHNARRLHAAVVMLMSSSQLR